MTIAESRTGNKQSNGKLENKLLLILNDLLLSINPDKNKLPDVNLDSNLDRDLGFDSLSRAELILRLGQRFNIVLPESLIGNAETPRDLLEAILKSEPAVKSTLSEKLMKTVQLPESAEPIAAETLIDVLSFHSERHPDRPHICVFKVGQKMEWMTYSELYKEAQKVANGLVKIGVLPGDRVAIMLPTERSYFIAFFGILIAGGIAVPIYPPFRRSQIEDHLRRQSLILENAEAEFLITDSSIRRIGRLLYELTNSLRFVTTVPELSITQWQPVEIPVEGSETALIQYTSGSTGDPKGVVLTHANLLANVRSMGTVMEASSTDIFVSWLPLYHDMGLIGAWFGTLYFGAPLIVMSPVTFLANPSLWLWCIHNHRATLSAAPNFAFDLCMKNIQKEDIDGLDLSSLRMIANGAEPVIPKSIRNFTEKFSEFGFRPEAMAPVYGLAENSVGLTFPPLGRRPLIDSVDRVQLQNNEIAETSLSDNCLEFVSCGEPLPGHEVRIVDSAGRELPERHQGRLQFKGPSSTSGYFRNVEKNKELIEDDWLNSGDLAYIADGEIYVTGRVKDLIIRGGRNIYPHEIEQLIGDIPGVRKGCVVAFASKSRSSSKEKLIVIAETRLSNPRELSELKSTIIDSSLKITDIPPDEVLLVTARTIPKTSSGKIRRSAARELFENGVIGKSSPAIWRQLLRITVFGFYKRFRLKIKLVGDYLYAGYWWTTVVLMAPFIWGLVIALPRRSWRHSVVNFGARTFFQLVRIPIVLNNEQSLKLDSVIIVANHSSYLDALVLSAAIRKPLTFIAKAELKYQKVSGPFLRKLGTIFVNRLDFEAGIKELERTRERIFSGETTVFFPEGTLTRKPGLRRFKLGPFYLSAQTGIPILPVTISGTRSILRGEQWFPRRGKVDVTVANAIRPGGKNFEAAVELKNAARNQILLECREPDLAKANYGRFES